jgi:hypothetical protein
MYGGLERATGTAEKLVTRRAGLFLVYEGKLVRTYYFERLRRPHGAAWEVLGDESEKTAPRRRDALRLLPAPRDLRWKEPVAYPKKEIARSACRRSSRTSGSSRST